MSIHSRLRTGLAMLRWREFAARPGQCPFCGPTVLLRLQRSEAGLRCARCAAGAVQISLGWALRTQVADLGARDVYELSSRGPLVAHLTRHARRLQLSEYFDGIAPGSEHHGVRCEDVQALSFADSSFDLITHTEVLEHVPDDHRAFAELYRVLRPGGLMLFTVPYHPEWPQTLERARVAADGGIEHLQPPAYHDDLLRGQGRVLAWRDYGADLPDRLAAVGFEAGVLPPSPNIPWQLGRCVVLAQRPPGATTAGFRHCERSEAVQCFGSWQISGLPRRCAPRDDGRSGLPANPSVLETDPQAAAQDYRDRIVGPVRGVLPDDAVKGIEEPLCGACTNALPANTAKSRR